MRFSRVPKMYPTEREANGAPLPTGWPTGNKMKMWTTNGAELAWLIEPQERTVTSWCPGCAPERLDALLQVTGEGPVAGFVLPLDRTFR